MQLSDILEENSLRVISQKTRISEDDLDRLLAKKFENLKKVKTLGFISILEREYNATLTDIREEAYAYYSQLGDDKSITLGMPIVEEKKGTSKLFLFIVLGLLGYATWYFLTQFDKKHLSELIPFIDEETIESFIGESVDGVEALSIVKVDDAETENQPIIDKPMVSAVDASAEVKVEETPLAPTVTVSTEDSSAVVTETVTDMAPTIEIEELPLSVEANVSTTMSIVPVSRLWFGVIDTETKKRKNFSISDAYTLDTTTNTWLLATSSAPFSLKNAEVTQAFNDAKEHYFKIDKDGAVELTKSDYVSLGGWAQW
ncbi:MAG TPA: hypothetical protein ENJ34_02030 [Epsilonproteobacteria bacterium]|nr:hypothetical protein [Campylobacterota bacterium]